MGFIVRSLNLLFLILFSFDAFADSFVQNNKKFLEQHQQRLEAEIKVLAGKSALSSHKNLKGKSALTDNKNGKFNSQEQDQAVLRLKSDSLEVVKKGLAQVEQISRFGELRDLNEVVLALGGTDPLDFVAVEEKSKELGLSASKAAGAGGSSSLIQSADSNSLNPECVARLKSQFQNDVVNVVCSYEDSFKLEMACDEIRPLCKKGRRNNDKHNACKKLLTRYCATPSVVSQTEGGVSFKCDANCESESADLMSFFSELKLKRSQKEEPTKKVDMSKLADAMLSEAMFAQSIFSKYQDQLTHSAKDDPKVSKFFKEVGAANPKFKMKKNVDFSQKFYAPENQGQTGACSAYATVADIEATGNTPKLSEGAVYSSIARRNWKVDANKSDLKWLSEINSSDLAEAKSQLKYEGVFFEEWNKDKKTLVIPESKGSFDKEFLNDFKNAKSSYQITQTASVERNESEGRLNVDLVSMKKLLSAGITPTAWIDSDKRSNFEEWTRIERGGGSQHLINIVGYDEGVDPSDGKRKSYFIVRDSLDKRGIHSKIPAENLLENLTGLEKVLAVKKSK